MPQSPLQHYLQQVQQGHFLPDSRQQQTLETLEPSFQQLQNPPSPWQQLFKTAPKLPHMYLVGDVGRGKTWIMDNFYQRLTHVPKQRWHFYAFMQHIQIQLQQQQGHSNPLARIAAELAEDYRLICLDEFFINHIKEAMIIRRLWEVLLPQNLMLITTSNCLPQNLYLDGVQRRQFLPTIALIQQHMQVLDLGAGQDFRRLKHAASHYYYPLNENSSAALAQGFSRCSAKQGIQVQSLSLNARALPVIAYAKGCVWVEFAQLCRAPHSELDYLSLATMIDVLILANIPQLSDAENDQVRRFISLIDILYDQQIRLQISAAVTLEDLYVGKMQADFTRTKSRLYAMTHY